MCKAIRDLMQHKLEEGREEGRDSGIRFIINNMIEEGVSDEDIIRFTKCSREVLEEVKLS